MEIDTGVSGVTVEIEGNLYPVAPKTLTVARKLASALEEAQGKERCRLWLRRLKILLGKEAVANLFKDGKNENLDRMEIIYLGVMDAFDACAKLRRAERDKRVAESVREMSEALAPLKEIMSAAGGALISRGG